MLDALDDQSFYYKHNIDYTQNNCTNVTFKFQSPHIKFKDLYYFFHGLLVNHVWQFTSKSLYTFFLTYLYN